MYQTPLVNVLNPNTFARWHSLYLAMAKKQCILSEGDIGSPDIEDELSSLTEITTLVGRQTRQANERRYTV